MKKIEYDVQGISDVGICKSINQDKYVYRVYDINGESAGLFAVADGVGGLENGEVASAMAISNVIKWYENEFKDIYFDINLIAASLENIFDRINSEISDYGKNNNKKMGTTLTVMVMYRYKTVICHIGDSRIYRLRHRGLGRNIEILTDDHSKMIGCQVDNEVVMRSMLTQCLGVDSHIKCDLKVLNLHKKDRYIICSDGIYKTQSNSEIKKIMSEQICSIDICSELINNAKRKGETDNITVIGIEIKEEKNG